MNPATARHLIDLNRRFYESFAGPFAATRRRLQPGVQRILAGLPLDAKILDLGCGNGELWRAFARRGQAGLYVGVDFSPGLLEAARPTEDEEQPALATRFVPADLAEPGWEAALEKDQPPLPAAFDTILAFAVLHHLPGADLQRRVLQGVHSRLAPGGRFIFSVWQFLNSSRLVERIQPWSAAGLAPEALDPGDYLLDWRSGGSGLRYVHHFDEGELAGLAGQCGFRIIETFFSDGENGRLGLYQVWAREEAPSQTT